MRKKYPVMRKRMVGRGPVGAKIMGWLGKINDFLKKSKVMSTLGPLFGATNPYAKAGLSLAKQSGYGRKRVVRRRRRGGSLRPVGGSLGPTGGGIMSLAPR